MEIGALTSEGVTLSSMLLLGLLGTGHCLGMCGPLVLALPGRGRALLRHLAYHLGRIATYTAIGALLAALGAGLRGAAAGGADPLGSVARLQVVLSILAATVLLVLGLARLGILREPGFLSLANPGRVPGFRALQARATGSGALPAVFALGLLLGLLPCGLSYAAFARVLTAEGPAQGALLVAAFGLGTLPGLLLLGTSGAAIAQRHRKLADLLAGVLLIGMAASIALDAIGALS